MRDVIFASGKGGTVEPRFTLRQLALFVAAVRAGSFTAAASDELVSPSAVSVAVRELERALGVTLVRRRAAHGVEATPIGVGVAERAAGLLKDATELQLFANGTQDGLYGPVAIGCFLDLAPMVLPNVITAVAERFPEVALDFTDEFVGVLRHHLDLGDLDFVVAYRSGLPSEYEHQALFATQPHVVLASSHPLATRSSITIGELEADRAILLDRDPDGDRVVDVLRLGGIEPRIRFRTPNLDLAAILVARGLGYCPTLSRPYLDQSQEGLPLVVLPLEDAMPEQVVAFWPRAAGLTARARAVLGLVDAASRSR